MEIEIQTPKLKNIPVNFKLIDSLYSNKKITLEARNYAFDFLFPNKGWGEWVSRLLLILGTTSIFAGIIFFFAFNWASLSSVVKLATIQFGIVFCLLGAAYYSLKHIDGQVLLLGGSILVGVFMAVFGQIYQTGADAYQLFMMWSFFILGWTILSKFAPQWILWLLITNTFLILWWNQDAQHTHETQSMIFTYLILLNGTALALREFLAIKMNYTWLQEKWTRTIFTLGVVSCMFAPVAIWIFNTTTSSLLLASLLGISGHIIMFFLYRYKLRDMWPLSIITLSMCLIVELFVSYQMIKNMPTIDLNIFFILGFLTIGIFTSATVFLKHIYKEFEVNHD